MMQLVAMFAFMLIPVWIPIIAVTVGALHDWLRPSEPSELTRRMAALQTPRKHQVESAPHIEATPQVSTAA